MTIQEWHDARAWLESSYRPAFVDFGRRYEVVATERFGRFSDECREAVAANIEAQIRYRHAHLILHGVGNDHDNYIRSSFGSFLAVVQAQPNHVAAGFAIAHSSLSVQGTGIANTSRSSTRFSEMWKGQQGRLLQRR